MIAIIFLILFLIQILISNRLIIDSFSRKISFIYLLWWGTAIVISTFDPAELYSVSMKTYMLLLINVWAFNWGFLCFGKIKKIRLKVTTDNSFYNLVIGNNKMILLLMLACIVTYYYAMKFALIIKLYGAGEGRMMRFEAGELFTSNLEVYLYDFLIKPFTQFVMLIVACMLLSKIKRIILLLSVLFLFLYASVGNGRGGLIVFLFYCFIIYYLRRELYYINLLASKRKKWNFGVVSFVCLFVGVGIIVVVISYMTAQRMGFDTFSAEVVKIGFEELKSQAVWYFLGSFRALDYSFRANYESITGFWYGRATMGGIDNLLKLVIHYLGGSYTIAHDEIGHLLQNSKISVGNGIIFNYAYTNIIFHYLDFGYVGVLLFPFLYGFIVRYSIYKFTQKPTLLTLGIMIYLVYISMFNIFSWEFQKPSSIIYVLLLLFFQYVYSHKFVILKLNGKKKGLCRHEC